MKKGVIEDLFVRSILTGEFFPSDNNVTRKDRQNEFEEGGLMNYVMIFVTFSSLVLEKIFSQSDIDENIKGQLQQGG